MKVVRTTSKVLPHPALRHPRQPRNDGAAKHNPPTVCPLSHARVASEDVYTERKKQPGLPCQMTHHRGIRSITPVGLLKTPREGMKQQKTNKQSNGCFKAFFALPNELGRRCTSKLFRNSARRVNEEGRKRRWRQRDYSRQNLSVCL